MQVGTLLVKVLEFLTLVSFSAINSESLTSTCLIYINSHLLHLGEYHSVTLVWIQLLCYGKNINRFTYLVEP